jgi:recombination protein RecR
MSSPYTRPVQALIDELGRLPGVGPRSAQRLAFHLLETEENEVVRLARAILEAKQKVRYCDRCFNLADDQFCHVCTDAKRDARVVCVVEDARAVVAIERTGEFRGRYHVLLGVMNPIQGKQAEHLKIRELLDRVRAEGIEEVILATSNNLEGEITARYLGRALAAHSVKVTRLASGLPVGGDLEYADELTLGHAIGHRQTYDS